MVPRTALALRLSIGAERLASYESGRAALPWTIGFQLCDTLNVNVAWLATGEGAFDAFVAPAFNAQPPPRVRFLEGYEKYYLPALQAASASLGDAFSAEHDGARKIRAALSAFASKEKISFTPEEFPRLARAASELIFLVEQARSRKESP